MVRAVLVTGGAGYIGAHTCKALSKVGYFPVVIDNLSTGHVDFVRWGPLVEADIRDTATLIDVLTSQQVCAVLHFAGSAYVGESVIDPQKYYENNLGGALSLLRAMRQSGCGKIVFSSTCAIYGEPAKIPIKEDAPKLPVNPYGSSKAMIERVMDDYGRAYGLNFVSLRYFNACGADPDVALGELRDPETHLIPRAMMAIQGHVPDFAVFGTDYPTPDGTAIRDYVHVSDLAEAHVASVARLLESGESASYNLGTGEGFSVKQVLSVIAAETKQEVPVSSGARRLGDPPVLIADASLAEKELDFKPTRSNLPTIVKSAWAWHRRVHPLRVHPSDAGKSEEAV